MISFNQLINGCIGNIASSLWFIPYGAYILHKFRGVKLPGGIEFNGREIYQDGVEEVNAIREQMSSTYELPPLDMIG